MKAILLQSIKDYPAGTEMEIVDSIIRANGYFYDCKTPNGEKILIQSFFLKITDKNDYIDWEQRRYEIAKAAVTGLCSRYTPDTSDDKEYFAIHLVGLADRLIKELKKK